MFFKTLNNLQVPLGIAKYKVKWNQQTRSKFQSRIKKFFKEHYRHLDWYEEMPLVGKDLRRLRWDFVCLFQRRGKQEIVFVEVQGSQHDNFNAHFHGTIDKFKGQMVRDELKVLFAAKNSLHPILEFYEDDPLLTLEWFKSVYGDILPSKN